MITLTLLALYIGSYAPFSLTGRYNRGPRAYIGAVDWCPAGLTSPQVTGPARSLNALGYLYYPLVVADRAVVHPSYHRC
jgi:hypothetical protein